MANPLRVHFWMLGQDARLGVLAGAGFVREGRSLYRRGPLVLHQLGLSLPERGLLYLRAEGRFYEVPLGTLPPELPGHSRPLLFREGWRQLLPHIQPYERWLQKARPQYRARLLRICPPALRPLRRHWREAFGVTRAPSQSLNRL